MPIEFPQDRRTNYMVLGAKVYTRKTLRKGQLPPTGWIEELAADPKTGNHPGWVPVREGAQYQKKGKPNA